MPVPPLLPSHLPPPKSLVPCGVRPQLLSHLSCLSHDCPCLVILSHLSLPWAQIPPGLAAGAFASPLFFLDPQNIALYEWLPSFLQKTLPEYTGEGMGWGHLC